MTDTTQTRGNPVPGGQVDDPGASDLQSGDFGLDGDLRATMLAALESRWNADDPGATTLDDDDSSTQPAADSDATPGPDPATTSPDAATPAAGEGGAGVGDAGGGEGAAPVDPSPPADPGTPSTDDAQFNLDAYAEQYFGTRLNPAQARELFAVLGGLQSLTPDQRAQVDQIVAGGAPNQYPVTTGQPVQQQTYPVPVTQPGTSNPPATSPATPPVAPNLPPRPPDDDYEAQRLYDQYIAPLAQSTQVQLAMIQENIAATTRAQQAAEQERVVAQIEASATSWRAQHPILSDGEYDALTDRITRSGTFPALINAHRGDVQAATAAALDQFFWADPNLRARAIANVASGRQAGDPSTPDPTSPVAQQAASADLQRQGRAASVAGGGGSTTSRGQTPAPKDSASRKAAMVQELAAQGDFS